MHAPKPKLVGNRCTIKHAFNRIFIRIHVRYTVQYIDTWPKSVFYDASITWVLMHASQYKVLRYRNPFLKSAAFIVKIPI